MGIIHAAVNYYYHCIRAASTSTLQSPLRREPWVVRRCIALQNIIRLGIQHIRIIYIENSILSRKESKENEKMTELFLYLCRGKQNPRNPPTSIVWWTKEDVALLDERVQCVKDQYKEYVVIKEATVDPSTIQVGRYVGC